MSEKGCEIPLFPLRFGLVTPQTFQRIIFTFSTILLSALFLFIEKNDYALGCFFFLLSIDCSPHSVSLYSNVRFKIL